MKKLLLNLLTLVGLFSFPTVDFAQAPNLGTAANFVLFSTIGAVSNTPVSHINGDVGTNNGACTGFVNVNGSVHIGDGVSATAANDLISAYNELNAKTPQVVLGSVLGNGQTLDSGVYTILSAGSLNQTLTLNANGDANAVFVFQIQGAFSTNALSSIHLINGAQICNVFWKVEGAISMAAGTEMKGTMIANNGAISMAAGVHLQGRALSTSGAIGVDQVTLTIPTCSGTPLLTGPTAPSLNSSTYYTIFSSNGTVINTGTSYIVGDVGTNVTTTTGFGSSTVVGTIHATPDASTAQAVVDVNSVYAYLNSLPYDIKLSSPAQFGNSLTLTPHTYLLDSITRLTDTLFLDAQGNSNAVFVMKVNGAFSTSSHSQVVLLNGAQAKNVFWCVEGAVNIGDYSNFKGIIVSHNGAIDLGLGTILHGKAFTTTGAITTNSINAFSSSQSNFYVAVCPNQMPYIWNGNSYNAAGTYTYHTTNSVGWDSTATIRLSINATSASSTSVAICQAAMPLNWNSFTYNLPGNFVVILTNSVGCDSVASLYLTIKSTSSSTTNVTICSTAMPYLWNGVNRNAGGVYIYHTNNNAGCDSAATLNLSVKTPTSSTTNTSICATALPYNWNGNSYNVAGTYVVHLTNAPGCDSAATLNLTVKAISTSTTAVNICSNLLPHTWNGNNYNAAGTYVVHFTNAVGCDSAASLILTLKSASNSNVNVGICPTALPYLWNGTNYNAAGNFTIHLTNSIGCDSAVTLHLTLTSSASTTNVSLCTPSLPYNWNGTNYNAAGNYTIHLTNSVGCDSAATLNLTVNSLPILQAIQGPTQVCVGNMIVLTQSNGGGNWTSNNNAIATVLSGGNVTGVNVGAVTINYSSTNACGTTTVNYAVTVKAYSASIGNYVWADTNRNGLQDEVASLGVNGVYIELYKQDSYGNYSVVATTTTANNGIGNPGYYNFTLCEDGNYKVKFPVYNNGMHVTIQTATAAIDGNSDADEVTGYSPIIVINTSGSGVQVNNATIDAGYLPTMTSVTSGGSGGVESKTLGDVIATRLYGNAKNNLVMNNGYSNATLFINSGAIVNGANDLTLNMLVPATVANTDAAYITTPIDLVNFTNAVEALAVDYTKANSTKAVAFATKTLGDIYAHTKPICDRLKGAELLEVKNITINGFNLMAYKIKQRTGEIEFAINLSAGTAANRSSISLQSNWFTDSYQQDEKLYNFQFWAVSYEMVTSMATDVITKLQNNGSVYTATTADLPKAYISKGSRKNTDLNLTIQNNTAYTSGYFEMKEKANENSTIKTRQVPFTIQPFNESTIQLGVNDNYEGSIYVYLNNTLTDLVYLADGTWALSYDKNKTTINQFDILNETSNSITPNNLEHRLLRNIALEGVSKDYISIYKTMMGGGIEQNLTTYNSLLFSLNQTGNTRVKITLVKKSIANWKDQYSYTSNLTDNGDYAVAYNQFTSTMFAKAINANDIIAVDFAFINGSGVETSTKINLSKARFTNARVPNVVTNNEISELPISIYPNPSTGRFTTRFKSETVQFLVLKITEISTGKIVKTQFINAIKGSNEIAVVLNASSSSLYIVTLEGDGVKYDAARLMMNK